MTEPRTFTVENLRVEVHETNDDLGAAAAARAAEIINAAIAATGHARVILATGNSQYTFVEHLASHDVDWSKVTGFHMDEYVGISADHPASFRRWMKERVEQRLGVRMNYIEGDAEDPEAECRRYEQLLRIAPIDLTCMGIGENGHLAFNEPGEADFHTERAVQVIRLTDESVAQQVGEGHFDTPDDVPREAISVTIPALLGAADVVVSVPEARKADAVRAALLDPVSTDLPATALRACSHAVLYLDAESASAVADLG